VTIYLPGESWLHRLDPRVKLWFALLGMTISIFTAWHATLAAALILFHIVLLTGGVSLRQIGSVWRSLALIILLILIAQPLLLPGDGPALWALGPIRVTEVGLLAGLRYGLRVAAATFAALIPVLTTPMPKLVRGLEKVGLPYTLGMTIGLALRYLATIGDLYATISEAQQARGWDLSQRGTLKRARAAVPTLIALIVASLRLSDSLALGLAARGFGGQAAPGQPVRRTTLHDIALTRADWLAMAIAAVVFAGLALTAL
jgi:energy-coupling factor transport system permease protein